MGIVYSSVAEIPSWSGTSLTQSVTLTVPVNQTDGFVFVAWNNSGGTIGNPTLTDTKGQVWSLTATNTSSSGGTIGVYHTPNPAAGSTTVTATFTAASSPGYLAFFTSSSSGGQSVAAVGHDSSFQGTASNAVVGASITPADNNCDILSFMLTAGGAVGLTAGTSPNAFTALHTVEYGLLIQKFSQTTATTIAPTATAASNADVWTITYALKYGPQTYNQALNVSQVTAPVPKKGVLRTANVTESVSSLLTKLVKSVQSVNYTTILQTSGGLNILTDSGIPVFIDGPQVMGQTSAYVISKAILIGKSVASSNSARNIRLISSIKAVTQSENFLVTKSLSAVRSAIQTTTSTIGKFVKVIRLITNYTLLGTSGGLAIKTRGGQILVVNPQYYLLDDNGNIVTDDNGNAILINDPGLGIDPFFSRVVSVTKSATQPSSSLFSKIAGIVRGVVESLAATLFIPGRLHTMTVLAYIASTPTLSRVFGIPVNWYQMTAITISKNLSLTRVLNGLTSIRVLKAISRIPVLLTQNTTVNFIRALPRVFSTSQQTSASKVSKVGVIRSITQSSVSGYSRIKNAFFAVLVSAVTVPQVVKSLLTTKSVVATTSARFLKLIAIVRLVNSTVVIQVLKVITTGAKTTTQSTLAALNAQYITAANQIYYHTFTAVQASTAVLSKVAGSVKHMSQGAVLSISKSLSVGRVTSQISSVVASNLISIRRLLTEVENIVFNRIGLFNRGATTSVVSTFVLSFGRVYFKNLSTTITNAVQTSRVVQSGIYFAESAQFIISNLISTGINVFQTTNDSVVKLVATMYEGEQYLSVTVTTGSYTSRVGDMPYIVYLPNRSFEVTLAGRVFTVYLDTP